MVHPARAKVRVGHLEPKTLSRRGEQPQGDRLRRRRALAQLVLR
jgi:hypothetical protein